MLTREAVSVITGLPKCKGVEELYQIVGLNRLEEIARENKTSQMFRLQMTRSGRDILKELGYGRCEYPVMADPPPPWEDGSQGGYETHTAKPKVSAGETEDRTLLANILMKFLNFFRIARTSMFTRTLHRRKNEPRWRTQTTARHLPSQSVKTQTAKVPT